MSSRTLAAALAAFVGCAGSGHAADPFEQLNDDGFITVNLMRHGDRQVHDLEGAPPSYDQDWIRVSTQGRHSYEVRVTGNYWDYGCGTPPCPKLERVTSGGTVLSSGFAAGDDMPDATVFFSLGQTLRWTAPDHTPEFVRILGDQFAPLGPRPYTVVFRDTTLLVPRWNSSGTQTTVLVLQNAQRETITGTVHFFNAAGGLVQAVGISVPPYGVQVLSTGSLPALAGLSGSAQVSHDGTYGGLTGKAVALEPATGFTFDTVIAPIPY